MHHLNGFYLQLVVPNVREVGQHQEGPHHPGQGEEEGGGGAGRGWEQELAIPYQVCNKDTEH